MRSSRCSQENTDAPPVQPDRIRSLVGKVNCVPTTRSGIRVLAGGQTSGRGGVLRRWRPIVASARPMTADDLGRAIPGTRPDTGAARWDDSDARKSGQRRSAICHAHQHHFLWLIIYDYGANDFMDRDLCPKVHYVRRTEQGTGLLVARCTAIPTC